MPRLAPAPKSPSPSHPDDLPFDHLTVLARLDELRKGMVVSLASLLVGFLVCFTFSQRLFVFVMAPVRAALPAGANVVATAVPEIFMVHLRMAVYGSVVVAAPVWLYQAWRFTRTVVPLRRAFVPIVVLAFALFLGGATFGHFVLFPYAVRFLTTVGSESIHVMLTIGKLFSFYSQFVVGLGLAFQIPTVVLILSKLSLVSPRFLWRHLRLVILVIFTIAAILTPTPDLVTQCLLALPMLGLYMVSIGISWLVTRGKS
ncbi:MAG TPA: twin-arginine translocase subunit TatC [Vicinamibacteria bacterium]|nr:twin-arginine translocase subunit TatC [Vicinamibacteria bacterium]